MPHDMWNATNRGGYFSQMLSRYLLAALLKSLKSRPSFSQNFDENIFIILGNFFSSLGYFFVKKAAKNINLNNYNKNFGLFPSTMQAP